MLSKRFYGYLIMASLLSTPALATGNETLAERGKRMCEEAGVPLEDCTILPPGLRAAPNSVAQATPEPRPQITPAAASYGTGKYGWCNDCTSLFAAAPVEPWSTFGGRQFQPIRDEDDRNVASNSNTAPGGTPGNGGGGDGGTGGGGDGGTGGGGDGGTGGGGDGGTGDGGDGGTGDGGDGGTADGGDGGTGDGGDGGTGDGGDGGTGDGGDGGTGDGGTDGGDDGDDGSENCD